MCQLLPYRSRPAPAHARDPARATTDPSPRRGLPVSAREARALIRERGPSGTTRFPNGHTPHSTRG